ncbi:gliding motility-associated C-terminal domain-containing protein [Daejeonella rubra]|uniref:gliding motility-associated C-terminal domain-containing protein n=1 Tax=Daejeonella rubra TaxID=990371 RepID=UPI000B83DB20|nr:gliding motility-associated C-terminal domain-containing protein [Daejeonella rubra]
MIKGQELIQMTVQTGESFYVHPEANVSIFSDVNNSGSIGSLKSSTINFLGQRWNSRIGSRIADEGSTGVNGVGGIIKFSGTDAAQYINTQNNTQGNTGFSNLQIANSRNVILEGQDLFVRNNVSFTNGRIILNSRNAVMELNSSITGYNENRYFVTGTGTNGGALVRKTTGLQQAQIIFPVGSSVSSYTPASVNYIGVAQDFKVRVFDNVYDKATYGTPDNINFVTKTWNISSSKLDPKASLIFNMQHNSNEEGMQFSTVRNQSFVSRFVSLNEKWDVIAASGLTPGIISSGNAIPNSYISSRIVTSGLTQNEYFSKSVLRDNSISNYRIPAGISPNNDGLNDKFVIENLRSTDKVRIEVYNRWQSLVFKDTNYKNSFDGIGNQGGLVNNILPDGTYYYILNFNDSKPITGYIIINR